MRNHLLKSISALLVCMILFSSTADAQAYRNITAAEVAQLLTTYPFGNTAYISDNSLSKTQKEAIFHAHYFDYNNQTKDGMAAWLLSNPGVEAQIKTESALFQAQFNTSSGGVCAPLMTFSGAGNPQTIPDLGCVNSIAAVPVTGNIGISYAIDKVELDISHTWDTDLDISLISPSGTVWDLSSDNGGTGDNYTNTVFQDGAPSIVTGLAPFTGTFEAEAGPFTTGFANEPVNGNWTLNVCDDEFILDGTLNSWSISLCPLDIADPEFFSVNEVDFSDPCKCTDPLNCETRIAGVGYLFHDTLRITSVTGLDYRINASTDFYIDVNCSGGTLTQPTFGAAGTQVPETAPGIYEIEFWRPSGIAPTVSVIQGVAVSMVPSNTFEPVCSRAICFPNIPTMNQWGLLIFGLLILNVGLILLYRFKAITD